VLDDIAHGSTANRITIEAAGNKRQSPSFWAGALTLKPWGMGGFSGASDSIADISEAGLKPKCKQRLDFSPLSTASVSARADPSFREL
jgi:hypothetical protein